MSDTSGLTPWLGPLPKRLIPGRLPRIGDSPFPSQADHVHDVGTVTAGTGPPPAEGEEGDWWFDNLNGDIYYYVDGEWLLVFEALNQTDYDNLVTLIEGRVRWAGLWSQQVYEANDMVLDGTFTMIANKQTTDRAAPQPSGEGQWLLVDDPTWQIDSATDYVEQGMHIVIPDGALYEVQAVRVWIEDNSEDATYRLFNKDNITGLTTVGQLFKGSIAPVPGWVEIATSYGLTEGDDITLWMLGQNHQADTTYNHPWVRGANSQNNVDPGVGNWTTDNQFSSLRISKTDDDAVDRSAELLAVTPGSIIRPTDEGDLSSFLEFEVLALSDQGTWVDYVVALVDTGNAGAPPIASRDQIYFEVPVPTPTKYVTLLNGFTPYPAIDGALAIGGAPAVISQNAHAVDMFVQPYTASDDWDIVSTSGGSGGGGGGSAPTPQLQQLEAWATGPTFLDGPYSVLGNVLTIPAGRGVVMDSWSDPENPPLVTQLEWAEQTIDFGLVTTRILSWVYIDTNGLAQFQTTDIDSALLRSRMFLGRAFHLVGAGGVLSPSFRPWHPIPNAAAHTLFDLIGAIGGSFLFRGADIIPNPNLTWQTNDSKWFSPGESWQQDRDDPNVANNPGSDPQSFVYILSDGQLGTGVTQVAPTMYESPLGTIATIPGSPNRASIQRVYATIGGAFYMEYGQQWYDNLSEAINGLAGDIADHISNPYVEDQGAITLIGYMIMEKGATDLQDGTDVVIINDDRLPIGGGGSHAHDHDATYLQLTGGTMLGDINMNDNEVYGLPNPPPQASSAVSLEYLNEVVALYLPLSGGLMSGAINMARNSITEIEQLVGSVDTAMDIVIGGAARSLIIKDDMGVDRVRVYGSGVGDFAVRNKAGVNVIHWDESEVELNIGAQIDMGDNKIVNMADGTNAKHAVTKGQMEALAALYLPLSGGTMLGNILGGSGIGFASATDTDRGFFLDGEDIYMAEDFGVWNKGYIGIYADGLIEGYSIQDIDWHHDGWFSFYAGGADGVYIDSRLNMGSGKIENMADPTVAQDAATKNYVDTEIGGAAYLPLAGGTMSGSITMAGSSILAAGIIEGRSDGALIMRAGTGQNAQIRRNNNSTAISVIDAGDVEIRGLTEVVFRYRQPIDSMQSFKELDMGSNKIVSLADGTLAQDAVTKAQLDAAPFVELAGDTMSGFLTLHADPSTDFQAATKGYVDAAVGNPPGGGYLPLGGGTMTGAIDMGQQDINNVTTIRGGGGTLVVQATSDQALSLRQGTPAENQRININPTAISDSIIQYLSKSGAPIWEFLDSAQKWRSYKVLDMNGGVNKIINLPDGTAAGDAVNKGQLDTAVGAYLPLAGGTMTGAIAMGGFDITNIGFAYVDNLQFNGLGAIKDSGGQNRFIIQDNGYVRFLKANGTGIYMEWDEANAHLEINDTLVMNSRFIQGVLDPVLDQDAATKKYVDDNGPAGTYLPLAGGDMTGGITMPAGFGLSSATDTVRGFFVDGNDIYMAEDFGVWNKGYIGIYSDGLIEAYSIQDTDWYHDGWFNFRGGTGVYIDSKIYLAGGKVENMGDPTAAQDAATKNYVDTAGLYLPLAGGTITGDLTVDGSIIGGAGSDLTIRVPSGSGLNLTDEAFIHRIRIGPHPENSMAFRNADGTLMMNMTTIMAVSVDMYMGANTIHDVARVVSDSGSNLDLDTKAGGSVTLGDINGVNYLYLDFEKGILTQTMENRLGSWQSGYDLSPEHDGGGDQYWYQNRNIRFKDTVGAPSNSEGIDGDVCLMYTF